MSGQDPLFNLIRSLDSSEKRYFKINATSGGEAKSNYVQLFDAIDAQGDEYDEAELKKKHAKKPFVKYLSAEKKYLREQIMKQMRAYRSELSVDNRIYELLQDEHFYRDKGLGILRKKTILKAKELALKYERFHLIKEALNRQILYTFEFEKKRLTNPVLDLIDEMKHVVAAEEKFINLNLNYREMFSLLRSGSDIENPAIRDRAECLYKEIEVYKPDIETWFSLSSLYYRSVAIYHDLFRNREPSFIASKKIYEIYQRWEHFKKEDAKYYKMCLSNLISRSNSAKQFSWYLRGLNEMKKLPTNNFDEAGEVFQNVYFHEHLYYINAGEFEKALSLVPIIEEGLKKYEAKINKARLLSFQFNIMIMYFVMHRFKDALHWADLLLADSSEIKQEQKNVTALLLPFFHFELGHHDLVDNLTRSAYRKLQKKQRLHEFEKLVIAYLKTMPLSPDNKMFMERLQSFNDQLNVLLADTEIYQPLGMDELNLWAESKLSGVEMSSLIKSRAS